MENQRMLFRDKWWDANIIHKGIGNTNLHSIDGDKDSIWSGSYIKSPSDFEGMMYQPEARIILPAYNWDIIYLFIYSMPLQQDLILYLKYKKVVFKFEGSNEGHLPWSNDIFDHANT